MAEIVTRSWAPRRSGQAPAPFKQRFGKILGQVAWARGFDDPSAIEALLSPRLDSLSSPLLMLNMDRASDLITAAVIANDPICIYGDYDMDGMSGLAVLVSFLRACGAANITYYQPDRLNEGYGVHPEAIRSIAAQGAKIVVTVDTGTSAWEAAIEAQKLGLQFIVTDHHQQTGEIPVGACVVNPNQKGDTSGLGYLSGAGMAFYTAIAVRSKLRDKGWFTPQRPQPDLRQWLDLLILGTIADQVELQGDNRALVRAGLEQLQRSTRPGLACLRDRVFTRVTGMPSAQDVAFLLAPKLNAASRMGFAALSTELLLTDSATRADELVEEILSLNQKRSTIQAEIFADALAQAQAQDLPVTVVHGSWHEGVLGIVAAKLVEALGKPAIVLAETPHEEKTLRGSMRTVLGCSCVEILEACKEVLIRFGGHEMAAGMQLKFENIDRFKALIKIAAENRDALELPLVEFDGDLEAETLSPSDVNLVDSFGPWGSGNPEPLFRVTGLSLENVKLMKEQHVKLTLPGGAEVVGFFKASELEAFRQAGHQKFDALIHPGLNRFRGIETVQFKLAHARPHKSDDSTPRS